MLKRYFNTFDKKGWTDFYSGVLIFILTCLLTVYMFRDFSKILAVLFIYLGLEQSSNLIGRATIGSIYRNKDGKNKEIYLAKKNYLDKRFEALYRGEKNGEEEKEETPDQDTQDHTEHKED